MKATVPYLFVLVVAIAPRASAQFEAGDLIVNGFGELSSIGHYETDGTHVMTYTGTGLFWEGASLTRSGQIVTTRRFPNGVNIFDPDGTEVTTFDTPEVTFVPGDVSVFADGTLAVGDQAGNVDLYTQAGTYVTTFTAEGQLRAFGSYVDSSDNLWVADSSGSAIYKFGRDGTLLDSFTLNFNPGDLVTAPDGTLWVSDRNNQLAVHLAADGQFIDSFATAVQGFFNTIALGLDGTIWAGGESAHELLHYTAGGAFLGAFDLVHPGTSPVFMTVVPGTACPWDCGDGDGDVGINDFLAVLAQWGTPGTCDFDGGGVGINDFLDLLAAWGPCP